MERKEVFKRKEVFICRKQKEVQMLRGFMAALEIIKRESAKWDGKVLNKRYTDAMTAAVTDVATYKCCGVQRQSVEVRFETTYYNERTGRIEIVWNDRLAGVVSNTAVYVSYYVSYNEMTVCTEYGNTYNESGRLNYQKLCNALDAQKERVKNNLAEYEKAINMADEVIQRYERINAILKDAFADVPQCLWGTCSVKASIY